MEIRSEKQELNSVVLFLSGQLDTNSASRLELELKPLVKSATDIILDFKDISYISSSGLHVLLQAHKQMSRKKRKLVIRNIGESVRDVFEMTGFINLITLE